MPETVLTGTPEIALELRRSARARRFSLRVSRRDGRVVLTLPARARTAAALEFARAHEGWLRATLAALPPRQPIAAGAS
ncbi:MAG: M48 family peptidase, partial [Rhodobacteraceae bacterium]|nr:M48 family peptidase [Paracoccaceae bacterium]